MPSLESLRTSSECSRGSIIAAQDLLKGCSGPPQKQPRGFIVTVQDLPRGPHVALITTVQDLLGAIHGVIRAIQDLLSTSHEDFLKTTSWLLKRYDRLMAWYYRVTVIPTFSWRSYRIPLKTSSGVSAWTSHEDFLKTSRADLPRGLSARISSKRSGRDQIGKVYQL